jgi:hypothetical protein
LTRSNRAFFVIKVCVVAASAVAAAGAVLAVAFGVDAGFLLTARDAVVRVDFVVVVLLPVVFFVAMMPPRYWFFGLIVAFRETVAKKSPRFQTRRGPR